MAALVEVIRDGDIAQLWLNRPAALNALSRQLMDELDAAVADLAVSDARAVILAGRGPRAFCAGADIKEFRPIASTVEARAAHYRRDTFTRIENLPMPTIAAVHGYTLGGGIALAIVCDIVIAAQNTVFGLPETGLGTFPGAGVTVRLPRLIGRGQAMRLICSGERIDAAEAQRIGLATCLAPGDDPMGAAMELARAIAANAPLGVRYAKECITRGSQLPPQQGIAVETDLNMLMDATSDYAEGARAFGERRKPVFHGR